MTDRDDRLPEAIEQAIVALQDWIIELTSIPGGALHVNDFRTPEGNLRAAIRAALRDEYLRGRDSILDRKHP